MSSIVRLNRRQFIAAAAALPIGAQHPRGALESPLLGKVRLGAEFFLNRSDTPEGIAMHFRRMAETGLTIARIFTIWDDVEPEQGRWDFSRYDAIYDAAARNGIAIANTLCSEDPPGWMGTAGFYHQWRDLSDPQLRPHSERYIREIVTRYAKHAAHGVWLLQNEPGIRGGSEPFLLPLFAKWLERKYGTVEALNKRWYRRLKRFEDVPFAVEPKVGGWSDYPSLLDWRYFWSDHLVEQQRWIHAEIDKYHPGSLTHINPPGPLSNMISIGRDLWKLRHTVHFLGASMHASWHFGAFTREEFGIAYGFCCDLIRSVSAPAPYWVTELQAGPTMFTGTRPLNPTEGDIRRWLWDGIGNGTRGIVFWLWHPRTEGNEAGEWGLAGASGEPTPRTEATKAVAGVLRKHDAFFSAARPQAARTAILYSRETMVLHALETWRKPSEDAVNSLAGCYRALQRAHVAVDFLGSDDLEAGAAGRYKVLYMPFCYALSERSAAAVREFVSAGGTVWADGLPAWKNDRGETQRLAPGPLSDVFGFTLEDVEARSEPFQLIPDGELAGEMWRCAIPMKSAARTILTAADGRPAAVEHRFGKGRALYYGTALSLAVHRRRLPAAEEWIRAAAVKAASADGVRMVSGPAEVVFRVLLANGKHAIVLNNWGAAGKTTIALPAGTKAVTDLLTGESFAGETVEVPVAAGSSRVLLA